MLNAVFVRLKVEAVVGWRDAGEEPAGAERLNAALIQYLSPWGSDVHGGWRTAAEVEGFVRSRPDIESIHTIRFSVPLGRCGGGRAGAMRADLGIASRHPFRREGGRCRRGRLLNHGSEGPSPDRTP